MQSISRILQCGCEPNFERPYGLDAMKSGVVKSGMGRAQGRNHAADVSQVRRLAPAENGAVVAKKRDSDDRRSIDRVEASSVPNVRAGEASQKSDQEYYLPQRPRAMAWFLLLSYVLAAGVAKGLPTGLAPMLAAFASVSIFACGSVLAAFERRDNSPRFAGALALIAGAITPMICAGLVFGMWVQSGLAWQWAVASMVCITAGSAALFGSRIITLFSSKLAIWASFALVYPSPLTVSSLLAAALALTLVARIEWLDVHKRQIAREARERLAARAEDILRSFEDTGQGWFWETDRRGLISYISPSAADVLGKTVSELLGRPLNDLVDMTSGPMGAERTLSFHLSARSSFSDVELRAAGTEPARWWALTGRPVYDSFQNFCGFRGHGSDLTEQRRSEQQVSRLAHYDSLTGLANRLQMAQSLERILASPRERDRACALFMLDLDRFKQVNDTLGHPAGDALLKQVAQRLERAVGERGRCGRLGGDEFEVIIPGQPEREPLGVLARDIIASLSQPYSIEGQSVVIGASVGIALSPEHGSTNDELIRNVDLALYAAKDAGRGTFRFYADDLHLAAEARAELESDLREAIADGQLRLHYQPVVHAGSEQITGFEALLRWKHPIKGCQSPAQFIPIAEDAGLIDVIGQWALRTACADLARWPASVRCAVNVSPLQFANPELPTIVANALAHAGVDPSRLELEITESVFLSDSANTDATFAALKRVGVRLALDDFGTGYSSLGYLKKAPFDKIKIDQSFVRGATIDGSRNGAIIASITSLAAALRMDTTAEGVESLDELELVRELGCSHIQGNIYHKALCAHDAAALVQGSLPLKAEGPRSARAPRKVLLKRIVIAHDGMRAPATLRSISEGGAMIDGVWGLAEGTPIGIEFSKGRTVKAQVRWTRESRIGVKFDRALHQQTDGNFEVLKEVAPNKLVKRD